MEDQFSKVVAGPLGLTARPPPPRSLGGLASHVTCPSPPSACRRRAAREWRRRTNPHARLVVRRRLNSLKRDSCIESSTGLVEGGCCGRTRVGTKRLLGACDRGCAGLCSSRAPVSLVGGRETITPRAGRGKITGAAALHTEGWQDLHNKGRQTCGSSCFRFLPSSSSYSVP